MSLPKRKYHKRGLLIDGYKAVKHPLYRTWHSMLKRCYLENEPSYKNYGARGINVDERWWHFMNFVDDMGFKPSPNHTLERLDNSKGYSKFNCVWASRTEQCLNRRLFSNNTTGETGVTITPNGYYEARYHYENKRYRIGRYKTIGEAAEARKQFEILFKADKTRAEELANKEKVSVHSTTRIKGISVHPDGGFIVRVTENKKRIYLGYYKTLEDAVNAKRSYDKSRD